MPCVVETRYGRFRVRHPSLVSAVLECVRTLDSVSGSPAYIERRDCGTGAGGFKPGNKCAGGGDGGGSDSSGGGSGGGGGDSEFSAARATHRQKLDAIRKSVADAEAESAAKVKESLDAYESAKQEKTRIKGETVDALMARDEARKKAAEKPRSKKLQAELQDAERAYSESMSRYEASIQQSQSALQSHEEAKAASASASIKALHEQVKNDIASVEREDGTDSDLSEMARRVSFVHENGTNLYEHDSAISSQEHTRKEREAAQAFIRDTMNPAIHDSAMTANIEYQYFARAHAVPGRTVLAEDSSASTLIHETGHQIEMSNPEAKALGQAFLASRTKGESPVPFKKEFPQSFYGDDEVGSPDNFEATFAAVDGNSDSARMKAFYAGKRYESGDTEVLTMGLELLHKNPAAFAKADPEWFDLVVGISTGRLLTETRASRAKKGRN